MQNTYKTLIIIESATICKLFQQFLGQSYTCMASYGLPRSIIKESIKQIQTQQIQTQQLYECEYEPIADNIKLNQLDKIRDTIKTAFHIIIAIPGGLYGEYFAWDICQSLELPTDTTQCIIFNEITKYSLFRALNNTHTIDTNLVDLHRINLINNIILSKTLNKYAHLNTYQIDALKIIDSHYYDELKKENNEKSKKDDNINREMIGYFTHLLIPFKLQGEMININDNDEYNIFSKNIETGAIITVGEPTQITELSPRLFNIISLIQSSYIQFEISVQDTINYVRKLFEDGYIYCHGGFDDWMGNLSFEKCVSQHIASHYGEEFLNNNSLNKTAEMGMIRPVDIDNILPITFNNNIKLLYSLIRTRTIQHYMSPSITSIVQTTAICGQYIFQNTSETSVFPGWTITGNYAHQNSTYLQFLSCLDKNVPVKCTQIIIIDTHDNNYQPTIYEYEVLSRLFDVPLCDHFLYTNYPRIIGDLIDQKCISYTPSQYIPPLSTSTEIWPNFMNSWSQSMNSSWHKNNLLKNTHPFLTMKERGRKICQCIDDQSTLNSVSPLNLMKDNTNRKTREIGRYNGFPLIIKTGDNGFYAHWDNNNISLKLLNNTPIGQIKYIDVFNILTKYKIRIDKIKNDKIKNDKIKKYKSKG